MSNLNKLIKPWIFEELLRILPSPRQKRFGRRRCSQEALLYGILQVLKLGIPWYQINSCDCSPTSCWRYFREIERRGKLQLIYELLVREKTDISEGAIDSTTVTSFRFRQLTGWDGKHKKIGTKISLFTDIKGRPADVSFGRGSKHDLKFVPDHLQKTVGTRKTTLNLDKGYTSLELRRNLKNAGTFVNMEMKRGDYVAKRGPKFRFDKDKYKVRFLVERTVAWLKAFWRLRIRRDYRVAMFKAFTYLALIIILIRS